MEQEPQLIPSMNEEDLAWLEAVPKELQSTARRYGRWLFSLVMSAGASNYGFELVARRTRGNAEIMKALTVIGHQMNQLIGLAVSLRGHTQEEFDSCRKDIELVATLRAGQPGDKRSPGGVLLTN